GSDDEDNGTDVAKLDTTYLLTTGNVVSGSDAHTRYLIRPTSPKSQTDSSRVSLSFESQDPFAFVEIIKLQVSEGVSWLLLFMVIFSGELTMGRANLGKTSQKLYFCNLPPRNGLLYDSVEKRCRFCPSYGIMVDVRIILQSAGDTGKVDLTMKVEEEFMELVEYQVGDDRRTSKSNHDSGAV
ncbi:UNVERIFIED_CONTAM: hypothetical protein Scaly_2041400, partial [Sesamum calycinum]